MPPPLSTHALNGVTQLGSIYVVIGPVRRPRARRAAPDGRTMDRAVHHPRRRRRGGGIDGDQGDRRSGASGVQPGGRDPRPVVPERSHDDRGSVLRGGCAASRPAASRVARAAITGGAVAIAVAVAASRVLLDVHWLTDVIGGLALGWAWFAICGIAFGGRLLRFGAGAEVAEAVVSSPSPRAEAGRSNRARPVSSGAPRCSAASRCHRSSPSQTEEAPSPERLRALTVPAERWLGNRAEPADLRAPRAAASADRLGTGARPGRPAAGRRPLTRHDAGNAVEVLIDGAEALPAIAAEMRRARSHVHLDRLVLHAGVRARARTATRGASRPARRARRAGRRAGARVGRRAAAALPALARRCPQDARPAHRGHARSQVALDPHERPLHCHHEKTIVIDDRIAFVGGIDLTVRGRRPLRHDRPSLRAATVGWHDVCHADRGPGRRRRRRALRDALARATGRAARRAGAAAEPAGDVELQIVRTVPEKIYERGPDRRLRDPRVVPPRAPRGRSDSSTSRTSSSGRPRSSTSSPRSSRIRRHPTSGCCWCCRRSRTAAPTTRAACSASCSTPTRRGAAPRLHAVRPLAGGRADPIYVHAKVGIVDDAWLTIGSANLNEHSLFNDTEMNIVTHDPALARETRLRLWAEHLELPIERPRRRPDRRDRHDLEADQQGAARAPEGRPAAHPPARPPAARLEALEPAARPAPGLVVDG